ncbi:transposase [Frankia sp. Mgl5]|uniref:IS1634 family transposase n=1 Tax=Frankia sp. Mgl5 TaxID=2933793 RepID=UPI0034D74BE0
MFWRLVGCGSVDPQVRHRQGRRHDSRRGQPGPGPRPGRAEGHVTNLPATVLPADQVIANYHDLWHVEQSFRMLKTDLAARPVFVRTRDTIDAHLTIVFTVLAVARTVQNRTGLAVRNVIRQLRPLRFATIAINGATQTFPPAIKPDKQAVLDAPN